MQTLKRREFLQPRRAARPPEPDGYWVHVSRTAMACRFEVTLPSRETAGVEAAREALDEVDRIEDRLTVFRAASEVSLVNRRAAGEAVRVSPSLFELLRLSEQLRRETAGAFDVTAGPLTRCWGFLRREGRLPEVREIEDARARVGGEKLALDDEARTVRFAREGLEINFGSIGKGYALDRITPGLRGRVSTALLSAGFSSMRAVGRGSDGRGWVVGVRDPRRRERRMAVLTLRDCAVSTSGSEEQFFEHGGRRYGHIIDPRTGYPSEGVAGVTVVAASAAVSDALATAFFVGGRALAEEYCARRAGVLALVLEGGAERAVVVGRNENCEVELTDD